MKKNTIYETKIRNFTKSLKKKFRPHGDEVRTVRLSNAAYYLLSASYDKRWDILIFESLLFVNKNIELS